MAMPAPPFPPPEALDCVVANPLWFIGVLLDAVATLAGTGGKQVRLPRLLHTFCKKLVPPERGAS